MTFQAPEIDQMILDSAGISAEALRAHALSSSASWDTAHRPHGTTPFLLSIEKAKASLDALYGKLEQLTDQSLRPLLELRENPRLLRSAINEMSSIRRKVIHLPRIGDEPRDAVLAHAYLNASGSVWNGSALRIYVEAVQMRDPLVLKELWALPSFLKFALLQLIITQANVLLQEAKSSDAETSELLTTRIKSLRELGHADWLSLMEPLVVFDSILRQDPARAYTRMDFDKIGRAHV